ncbi:MAG: helix-turn-helix transcriptional regulator [Burkholderiales bacterium]|nr:helix-turn-helix transcriptional regulator [Burkholderiales bacterium]
MSTTRQPDSSVLLMRSLALTLPVGMRLDGHAHAWPQLVFAARGALAVAVTDRQWVVPPTRALWVPAHAVHEVEALGDVSLRTLYLASSKTSPAGQGICVLDVSPLLRELILEVTRIGSLEQDSAVHQHLAGLIHDQLGRATRLRLELPLPRDPRARRVADLARADLRHSVTLSDLAADSGASARTIERLFHAETGLAFGQWRQQARLQHALRRLAESADVATAAAECGYESVSAFVSMFRQALGVTPGQYLRGAKE